ncbi:MAG: sigma 54-interacting transcriptional regulator [Kofleriaceae bacterium]
MDRELAEWRSLYMPEVVGDSEELVAVVETVRRVAATDCSVLINGETGTGKELFARAVHRASPRRSAPFVAVNCAAIPETLLETELFGHVKGAFTGALVARAGRFLAADGGTIFLDEIGDLPLAAQAKLLRVLEARTISPLGADAEVPVDLRVIAATHRDLEAMVREGTFRADLYFRLAVVPLCLPPLRERGDDLRLIAEACLQRVQAKLGRPVSLDDGAVARMRGYHWPGNVRELSHVLERAVILARRPTLGARDLSLPERPRPARPVELFDDGLPASTCQASLDLRTSIEQLERNLIDRALQRSSGNRTEAAALLGLNRTTLVEKLRKYA